MKSLLLILLTLPSLLFSQIIIDKAGDGWDLKIDSALQLIKKTDIHILLMWKIIEEIRMKESDN